MDNKQSSKQIKTAMDSKYNYKNRLNLWRKYATVNKEVADCKHCNKTHAHKSILLSTNEHVCWYCWIRKDANFGNVTLQIKPQTAKRHIAKKAIKPVQKIIKKPTAVTKPVVAKNSRSLMPATKKPVAIIKPTTAKSSRSLMPAKKVTKVENIKPQAIKELKPQATRELKAQTTKEFKAETFTKSATSTAMIPSKKTRAIPITNQTQKNMIDKKHEAQCKECDGNCICDNPEAIIVKKYIRLAKQPIKEKFSLSTNSNTVKKGTSSYDKKANYAIEMVNISKSFLNGKVIANDSIDLRVLKNEVHAIIGENGAGKSTLMSILFGLYSPDEGTIKINGKEVNLSSAKDAAELGLGMVHQHFQLVPTYTVFENVILGSEQTSNFPKLFNFNKFGKKDEENETPIDSIKTKSSIKENETDDLENETDDLENELVTKSKIDLGFLNNNKAREKIEALVVKYKLDLNIDSKISKLTVGQQQKTEILKLLYRDAEILILDEPTAVLSPNEIEQFLKMVKDLKKEGKTIILITHKFNEIKSVADRATIIRLGRFVSDFNIKDKTIEKMAEEMVGKAIDNVQNVNHTYKNDVLLDVKGLELVTERTKQKEIKPIDFAIHGGEIFAIAGVEGNGQAELALAIAGLESKFKGKIEVIKKIKTVKINEEDKTETVVEEEKRLDVTHKSVYIHNLVGISHIPESRHKHGLILDLPISTNAVINQIDRKPFSNFGVINEAQIREYTRHLIKEFDIRGSIRGTSPARGLSGGNQQKLILARELSHGHRLIIMMQPTRGLDLGAVSYIHKKIIEEKEKGNAVLLISYEIDEILALADTIAVMSDASFADVGNRKKMTRQHIAEMMAGKE